jgi:CheY-like chemotaxis protein
MNLEMPVMDGIEATRRILSDRPHSRGIRAAARGEAPLAPRAAAHLIAARTTAGS